MWHFKPKKMTISNIFINSFTDYFGQANVVADSLTTMGSLGFPFIVISSFVDLPKLMKGLCNVDRFGIG